jgi:ribonuclease Y
MARSISDLLGGSKDASLSTIEIQAKEIILKAKEKALKIREQAEKKEGEVEKKLDKVEKLKKKWEEKLEKLAGMTKDKAKEFLLKQLEKELVEVMATKIKEAEGKASKKADEKAKEILVTAIQRAGIDYVAEYTTSTIKLKDEEIKGRVIGKEGRNIRAFEKATGVDVELEEEGEITLSSFDPIRRATAKEALERLIADGRIQPARIEQFVKRTKMDFQERIRKAGEELCFEVGVASLPDEIVELLGRFKYRTSYGQSLYQHTLEVVNLGKIIAAEIGADVYIVKAACLLHDIGKVLSHKLEGSHTKIAVDLLVRYGIAKPIVDAVASHHEEEPIETPEQVAVYLADSISGARPGARYEPLEEYLQRVKKLENIAKSFDGVVEAFAIEAGREVRVIVKPKEISDAQMTKLSHDIARKIHEGVTYPGQVKVTVIRELRKEVIT